MASYLLESMLWGDVKKYLEHDDTIVLPIGSTEVHGSHLPTGTDALIAIRLAAEAGEKAHVMVAPPIWYGYSPHHLCHEGSVSVRAEVLIGTVVDVCMCYIHHGLRKIVIINGHREGNLPPLKLAAERLRNVTGAYVAIIDPFYIAEEAALRLRTGLPGSIGHGGEMETSHMLAVFPDLVDMSLAASNVPSPKRRFHPIEFYDRSDRAIVPGTAQEFMNSTHPSGMTGDALAATKEKGVAYHREMVGNIVEFLAEVKQKKVALTGRVDLPF